MEYFFLFPLVQKNIKIDQEIRELYSKIKWHLFPGHGVYYPNVITLRSGTCYRKSVCLVHSTQPVEIFRNISTPFCTLAIR